MPTPLAAVLHADSAPGALTLRLEVHNVGDVPVTVTFPTAQHYELVAHDAATGAEVWRWGADRSFAQALSELPLVPDEMLAFTAHWMPAPPGRYEIVAWLAGTPCPPRVRLEVSVPPVKH